MKSYTHGQTLSPIEWDAGVEVIERHGRRAELLFQAAQDGVEPELMVAWADTTKQPMEGETR